MDIFKDGEHHVGAIMVASYRQDHTSKESPRPLKKYGNTMIPGSVMYKDYQEACADHLGL